MTVGRCLVCGGDIVYHPANKFQGRSPWVHKDVVDWQDHPHPAVPTTDFMSKGKDHDAG